MGDQRIKSATVPESLLLKTHLLHLRPRPKMRCRARHPAELVADAIRMQRSVIVVLAGEKEGAEKRTQQQKGKVFHVLQTLPRGGGVGES